LEIEIKTKKDLAADVVANLELLPETIILPKNALTLGVAYREYLASILKNSNSNVFNKDLASDYKGRTFRKILDCDDTCDTFIIFWKTNIEPKLTKQPLQLYVEFFERCMSRFYLLFSSIEFKFNDSDPFLKSYGDQALK